MSETPSIEAIVRDITALQKRNLQIEKTVVESPRGVTLKLHGPAGDCAIKLSGDALKTNGSHPPTPVQREAAILQTLCDFAHNLYLEHGRSSGRDWLLLNWIEGRHAASLGKAIRQNGDGSTETKRAFVKLFIELATKVSDLHRLGYVHRDLQPSHFIRDERGRIHLIDFGLTKHISEESSYYTGGLVHFDPPETARALLDGEPDLPLDFLTDTYSFGAVLFFSYTGVTPTFYSSDDYRAVPMKQMLQQIADGEPRTFHDAQAAPFPELEEVLRWCMHPRRKERCSSLNSLLRALQDLA